MTATALPMRNNVSGVPARFLTSIATPAKVRITPITALLLGGRTTCLLFSSLDFGKISLNRVSIKKQTRNTNAQISTTKSSFMPRPPRPARK